MSTKTPKRHRPKAPKLVERKAARAKGTMIRELQLDAVDADPPFAVKRRAT